MNLKKRITNNLLNIPGWHTKRHIIVIESDDWGSIRMPSKDVYNRLLPFSVASNDAWYNLYDSLASEEDLNKLLDLLSNYIDKEGNHPVITANCVVANPDFDKIRQSNFKEYHYELFTDTLKKYPNHTRSFELWKKGIEENLFYPQFHGREHLNVQFWMKCLRNKNDFTLRMFDEKTWGMEVKICNDSRTHFLAGYNYDDLNAIRFIMNSINDGMKLFESLFGYKSKTFIANCYTWDQEIEKCLLDNGVIALQGSPFQSFPIYNKHVYGKKGKYHFCGTKNEFGQIYLVRNVTFEPSMYIDRYKALEECLCKIQTAFRWNKPAIISSHRLNFIGNIEPNNRDVNLVLFKKLLDEILKKWPDVEFMSSDQLADLITG